MYINEIPVHTDIIIKAKLNNNETTFITNVVDIDDKIIEILERKLKSKVLIVKLVELDGKVVSFDVKTVKLEIEASVYDKCYIWKRLNITNLELGKYGKCTVIISNETVNYVNRRNNFRVSVGLRSITMIGLKRVDSTVKDISNKGIGLIVDKEVGGTVGDVLRVSFDDAKRKASFNVECTIARIQEINDRKQLFGCVISNIRPDPSYYITRLQRESLQHK